MWPHHSCRLRNSLRLDSLPNKSYLKIYLKDTSCRCVDRRHIFEWIHTCMKHTGTHTSVAEGAPSAAHFVRVDRTSRRCSAGRPHGPIAASSDTSCSTPSGSTQGTATRSF